MGEVKMKENPTKGIAYKPDLEYVSKCILDFPNTETGGELFGSWSHSGYPIIHFITGPGPKSFRSRTFFRQDLDYITLIMRLLSKNYGLQHIGSWHSHHSLGLEVPSSHDFSTMVNAIEKHKIQRFMMILGNIKKDNSTTIKGYLLYKDKDKRIKSRTVSWVVLDRVNPIAKDFMAKNSGMFFYEPHTSNAYISELSTAFLEESISLKPLAPKLESWVGSKKGQSELKSIQKDLGKLFSVKRMMMLETGIVSIEFMYQNTSFDAIFMNEFPFTPPVVRRIVDGMPTILNTKDLSEEKGKFKVHRTGAYIHKIVEKYFKKNK